MQRIGFITDGKIPTLASSFTRPWRLLLGWPSTSAVGSMRHGWIAREVNRDSALHYEAYRPHRHYAAVVFLKSMSPQCAALAARLRASGTRVVFDLNVDYLTPAAGAFYYEGMAPTAAQRADVLNMFTLSDGVIADSSHLSTIAAAHHPRVRWVPDNVAPGIVPAPHAWRRDGKLPLLWSGESVKLFELLKIAPVLRRYSAHVRLVLITNSLAARTRWFGNLSERVDALLGEVETQVLPFRSVPALLETYAQGGVFIAPRFLDNTYNLGHTEWKITLPMACGRVVLGCPVPSYRDVAARSGGRGLRLCETEEQWCEALDAVLSGGFDFSAEEEAARTVVRHHYSTPVVAKEHRRFLEEVLAA